jgi:plastocyanin
MKTIKIIVTVLAVALSLNSYAQDKVKTVKLEQTEGVFTKESLKLKPGKYVFEVTNKEIDHKVAFVLAPKKENVTQEDHITNAYLANPVGDGETAQSKEVILKKGTYVYFCPMNPTPQYTLVVK